MTLPRCVVLIAIIVRTAAAQSPPLHFEVASIKAAKADAMRGGLQIFPGGGLRMDGATLRSLVAFAYDVREEQVAGGQKWVGSTRYDVLAKPAGAVAADTPSTAVAPGTTAWDRMRLRLQALLAERFRLVVHKDEKEVSGQGLPDILKALQERLGAKLEAGKVATRTIVIDRAEN